MIEPTFGQRMRGFRIGFRWLEEVEAFVRIRIAGPDEAVVEVRPGDELPSREPRGEHLCWWDDDAIRGELVREIMANGPTFSVKMPG